MTKNDIKGLSSMSVRLAKLEDVLGKPNENDDDDSLTKMINRLREKDKMKKKETMQSVLEHFESDIYQVIDPLTTDNVVSIVVFSIQYVEGNSDKLASYLGVKLSSEFKKSLACSFTTHLVPDIYTEEMICLTIDTIHKLLYPKKIEIADEEPITKIEKKKKKSFF